MTLCESPKWLLTPLLWYAPAGYCIKTNNNFKKGRRAVDDGRRELPLFALPIDPARFQFSLSPTSLGHNKRPLRRREVPTLSALKVAFCTPAFMSHRISVFSSKVTTKSPLEATTSIRRLLKWLLRRVCITVPKRKDKEVGKSITQRVFQRRGNWRKKEKVSPGKSP